MKIISIITLTILMGMILLIFSDDIEGEFSFFIGVPCLLFYSIAGFIDAKKESITYMKIMSLIGFILFGGILFIFFYYLGDKYEFAGLQNRRITRVFLRPAFILSFLYAFPYLIVGVIYSFRSNKISGNEFISTPEDKDKDEVQTNYSKADEISKYKKLMDEGAITQLEFDNKKRNILDNI